MAGHSKWHNIRRHKGAQDVKRGKIFMRHAKLVYQAAKEGGGDPDTNPALRLAIEKARDDNMPNDNITRAIQKATGTLEGVSYEEMIYEGYGPSGVPIIVHVLTDNRNRTAAELRHAFSKHGGNLGETGCVSFMFDRKGYIVVLNEDQTIDEDELTLEAIEAGAEDIDYEEGVFEIYMSPEDFEHVATHLQTSGYELEEKEITLVPQTYSELDGEDKDIALKLIDALEDLEDVQDVHHNIEITE